MVHQINEFPYVQVSFGRGPKFWINIKVYLISSHLSYRNDLTKLTSNEDLFNHLYWEKKKSLLVQQYLLLVKQPFLVAAPWKEGTKTIVF